MILLDVVLMIVLNAVFLKQRKYLDHLELVFILLSLSLWFFMNQKNKVSPELKFNKITPV